MKKIFAITLITVFLTSASMMLVEAVSAADADVNSDAGCSTLDSRSKCYQQLSPIMDPATNKAVDTKDFPTYLQGLYRIGIGACFVLGVIMFTWAGIEYILSESMTKKSDAKARIAAALTGLAIALVSYVLLQTINPKLLEFTNLDTTIKK